MFRYQLKIDIAKNNRNEFIDSLRYLSRGIRAEENCFDFNLYRDFQKKDAFVVTVEWKTRQAMENHFMRDSFSVLIGATKVLGINFEISIDKRLEKGSYQAARKKIALATNKLVGEEP